MRTIEVPYSGEALLAHLFAYGVLAALRQAGETAFVSHPASSLTCTPTLHLADGLGDDDVAAAIRATAAMAADLVEADLVPGATGNDRRSVVWARATFSNDPSQADEAVRRREQLLRDGSRDWIGLALAAGLGCPATWGGDRVKPSHGATALDGVIGNHTSDFVRGVLRPARTAASTIGDDWIAAGDVQPDKTGWAPPGTTMSLEHQWVAALGLTFLPVAHRPFDHSRTPAAWRSGTSRTSGVVTPLLARPTSAARLRAVLGLAALPRLLEGEGSESLTARAELRALGVSEAMVFDRVDARGTSSVAFTFRRGRRTAL